MVYKSIGCNMQWLWDYLNESVDVTQLTDRQMVCLWVSELEQMIYRNIIKEIAVQEITEFPQTLHCDVSDIDRLIVNGMEYERASPAALVDEYVYYTFFEDAGEGKVNRLYIKPEPFMIDAKLYTKWTPDIKTAEGETFSDNTIYLPDEWIKIVTAYCKAMIYKEVNEFVLSNNYLSEYNAYLEDFVIFVQNNDSSIY